MFASIFAFGQAVEIVPGNDTTLCTNQTLPLTVTIDPLSNSGGSTTTVGYDFLEIPINAGPTTGTNLGLNDDAPSGAINIGFPFQYFGTPYNQLYVSPNGFVSFAPNPPSDYTPEAYPTCNGPNQAIIACWQDFDPGSGGNVRYTTTGTAPNRRFIISWNNVAFFSTCATTSSFQIHLFETTNIIEIHLVNKPACPTLWNTGAVVATLVGSNSGTNCNCYYQNPANAAGFNNTTAGFVNRAFRYTPIQGTLNGVTAVLQSLQWSVNGTNVGPANSPNYTAFMLNTTSTRTVVVTATFTIPCIGNVVVRDTVVITPRQYNPTFTTTTPICAGQETSLFTFTGTPAPVASTVFAWNFDGGTGAPGTGIGPHDVSWATPGTKNVSLTLSGGACAPGTFNTTVEVVSSPTSTFTATPQVCGAAPVTVTYTGNAPASATYTWDFDGGTPVPASGQGPFTVTWSTPGVKTVRLSVGIGSCVSAETTVQVTVLPPPTSTFTVSPTAVCEGQATTLTYTGNAPAGATYTWNFNGGVGVPATGPGPINVTWATGGTKSVTLQVDDNGCVSNTTTRQVTVYAIPTATFTATPSVCPSQNATITYTGTGTAAATFAWNWDSGTANSGNGIGPHTVNWANSGVKNISLTVTQNGCVSTEVIQSVTVNPIPTSTFTATPAGICVGANASLAYTGTAGVGATYTWNFAAGTANPGGTNSGNQQVSWATSGIKNVTLTVTDNGCVSPITTLPVEVFPTPTANFTTTAAVCPGDDATVTYIGSGTAGAMYTWNFNGGVATPVPSGSGPYQVNWASSGTKNLSLVVEENGCASQPFNQTVLVYNIPSSTFTAVSPICAGASTQVSYTGSAASTASYAWDFPGGTPLNPSGQGPQSITFNTAGTYLLNLAVTENGCVSQTTQVQVVVNPIPTSTFSTTSPVCLDGFTTVNYIGTAPASAIYNWDFGGGISAINVGPGPIDVHWDTPGPKTITLSVNSLGCNSAQASTEQVTVLTLPLVDAGIDKELCSGAAAQLGSLGDPNYTYSWSPQLGLADPTSSLTNIQVMNNTNNSLTYLYILTADDGQCVARDSVFYSVTAPPFVSFASPFGQCFDGHSFSFLAQGEFTPTANFIWNFGPNANTASSSVINPSNIVFNSVGSQTVSLQVDDNGCFSNLYTADVVVYPEPLADFYTETTAGCDPLEVKFINISQGPANMQYDWNFGAGQPSASEEPSFLYAEPGTYDVSLNVTTQNGCTSSMDRKEYINVFPTPTASFDLSAVAANIIEPEITMSASIEFADSIWYFITPHDTTLYGDTITYSFPDTGTYLIKQFVGNQYGCVDSTDNRVSIITGYRVYIPNSFSPNNDGINDYFRAYGESIQSYSIVVYNRWGQQIYASYDIDNGWDGKSFLSDEFVQPGVYLYRIEITDELEYTYKYEGAVNVVQ